MLKLITILVSCLVSFETFAKTKRFQGKAYDIYTEKHKAYFRGSKHISSKVTYVLPSGKKIAVKKINYKVSKTIPTFKMTDYRTGLIEGATNKGKRIELYAKSSSKEKLKSGFVKTRSNLIVDAGFVYFKALAKTYKR